MRNPFKHSPSSLQPGHSQEQVDAAYTTNGWGAKVEREVPRASGPPVLFRFRMPNDIRLVELGQLVAAARDAPAWIASQTETLEQAAARAGSVLVGAIVSEDKPTDVLATLTVVFSEQVRDPAIEIREPGPDEKVKQTVKKINDRCTMVNRLSAVQLAPGEELTGLLVQEYMWRTEWGGLVMAFSTTHDGMFGDTGTNFFVECAKNAQLVEPGTVG